MYGSSTDRTHWNVRDERYYTLEATAYALLALIKAEVSKSHLHWKYNRGVIQLKPLKTNWENYINK